MSTLTGLCEKVFDGFKKVTPALIAILIASGAFLFLPESILTTLNLLEIKRRWEIELGIVFYLSCVLVIVIVATIIFRMIQNAIKKRLTIHRLRKHVNKLSESQKKDH